MRIFLAFIIFIFFSNNSYADEASVWLKKEIDVILQAYKNENISSEKRFLLIENTINYNFAGAGIAKFISGDAWAYSDKKTKKKYVSLFKRHLALNIASMMQGYSNQQYKLENINYDSKNQVSRINMEIFNDASSMIVTWRVKKSKNRFFVIDLLVADISLVVTKRSEFNSMLKKVEYDLEKFNLLLEKQNKDSYNKLISS